MIIKEKKYSNDDLIFNTIYLNECSNNFIILDDNSKKLNEDYKTITEKINGYDYNLTTLSSNKIMENLISYLKTNNLNDCFDAVVLAGCGGKQMYETIKNSDIFLNKEILDITWHRTWNGENSIGFETNIEDYKIENKKIIIIEDVIASGNTLWTLKTTLEKYGAEVKYVISALIQESSPIITKSFSPIYSGIMINKPQNQDLDPFWYPPIYSLRHLLHGDDEMPKFYQILNSKYFNNENDVELLIKKYRKEI